MTSNNTLTYIADHLRQARQKQHMTQAEVAEKAGISTNFYARIERGETGTSILILESIIKALKTKSGQILPF
jgi:transcriptional regulator with XRE-family HTH domain